MDSGLAIQTTAASDKSGVRLSHFSVHAICPSALKKHVINKCGPELGANNALDEPR